MVSLLALLDKPVSPFLSPLARRPLILLKTPEDDDALSALSGPFAQLEQTASSPSAPSISGTTTRSPGAYWLRYLAINDLQKGASRSLLRSQDTARCVGLRPELIDDQRVPLLQERFSLVL